eukprot:10625657-Alexandrium_andersonii.AAC.1
MILFAARPDPRMDSHMLCWSDAGASSVAKDAPQTDSQGRSSSGVLAEPNLAAEASGGSQSRCSGRPARTTAWLSGTRKCLKPASGQAAQLTLGGGALRWRLCWGADGLGAPAI